MGGMQGAAAKVLAQASKESLCLWQST